MSKRVFTDHAEKNFQRWSKKEEETLKEMVLAGFNSEEIASELGRTRASVFARKARLGIDSKIEAARGSKMPYVSYAKTNRKAKGKTVKAVAPKSPLAPLFQIDNDWRPSKVFENEIDSFLSSIINTSKLLQPGQSFAVPVKELATRYGWDKSATNSLRHLLKKKLSPDYYGRLKLHEVKDFEKNLLNIRVRRVPEAI